MHLSTPASTTYQQLLKDLQTIEISITEEITELEPNRNYLVIIRRQLLKLTLSFRAISLLCFIAAV